MIVFDDGEQFKGKPNVKVQSYADGKVWGITVDCEIAVPVEVLVAALRSACDTIEARSCKRRARVVKVDKYFAFLPKAKDEGGPG